ncbi:MAG: SDR family oxidoreductase [Candidatus Berkelbacteria bacterium]|nr:SDR family oxidoreductase [Candidatus Berkelbacteria bacterium]
MRTLHELMSLEGRVCLITGGAGHIGMAMAESLAEMGAKLILVDFDEQSLTQAKLHILNLFGQEPTSLVADLANEDQRMAVPEFVQSTYGRLDVLINNAAFTGDTAIAGWATSFEKQTIDAWRSALEVNLTAAFHLSQLLSPMLKQHGQGVIANIGSIYGLLGPDLRLYEGTDMASPAAYAASKGGLVQLTRWLATVLAPEIRVNCISPGGVFRNQPSQFVKRYEIKTPLQKMATEEDLKGAIAYLASDMSAYVTGHNLMVDGGWTAW